MGARVETLVANWIDRRWHQLAGVGMLAVLVCGCSKGKNTLKGSLGEVYDLSFSSTRARLYDSEFAVEYVRDDKQVPVRVVVDRSSDKPLSTGTIDLDDRGTVVGRIDARRLPDFESGKVELGSFRPKSGAPVRGSFDATLVSGGSTYSLRGQFSTSLEVVDESLGYESDAFDGDAGDAGRDAYGADGDE